MHRLLEPLELVRAQGWELVVWGGHTGVWGLSSDPVGGAVGWVLSMPW